MADVASDHVVAGLLGRDAPAAASFAGADMSTKLKLLGCDVANFGVTTSDDALAWDGVETNHWFGSARATLKLVELAFKTRSFSCSFCRESE